jgi:hypothetical protein
MVTEIGFAVEDGLLLNTLTFPSKKSTSVLGNSGYAESGGSESVFITRRNDGDVRVLKFVLTARLGVPFIVGPYRTVGGRI